MEGDVTPQGVPATSSEGPRRRARMSEAGAFLGGAAVVLAMIAGVATILMGQDGSVRQEGVPDRPAHLAAGMFGACAVTDTDGTICWGWDEFGQLGVPDSVDLASVSSGIYHNCGLTESGEPICWGDDEFGKSTLPPGPYRVLALGAEHTCGLREDGSVSCAGRDNVGQTAPPPGERLVSLVAMVDHSCGLREDGTAVCWGSDTRGETVVPQDVRLRAIDVTHRGTCGLTLDGTVECWGRDDLRPEPGGPALVSITLGMDHACGLSAEGEAFCWGSSRDGESTPPEGVRFVSLSAGDGFTCGITDGPAAGVVRCWGYGDGAPAPAGLLERGTLD